MVGRPHVLKGKIRTPPRRVRDARGRNCALRLPFREQLLAIARVEGKRKIDRVREALEHLRREGLGGGEG